MRTLACSIAAALSIPMAVLAANPESAEKPAASKKDRIPLYYNIEALPMPPGVDPQVGGLAVTPDGRLVAAFHRGQVAYFNPKDQAWKIFAEGLHEPLGVLVDTDGSVLVMQRPELTRLRDTTGKGVADSYETVWDGFGISGNYHEFAFGPVRGPNGKLYVALNTASNGDTVHEEIRGEWKDIGVPRADFYNNWKKVSKQAGRMYSRVAYRGCVMEIDPYTGAGDLFATGFRSPDGINFDGNGNLMVSDNQGDWRGACELFMVQRGGFYGHPASLVWRKDWDGADPTQVSIERLNQLRTPAPIWFPYGSYANSTTQMLQIPKTPAWGLFGGQMLIGEMNAPTLLRILPEKVDGVWEGATAIFIHTQLLKRGLHRFAFIGDTLYAGHTHLSWAGGEGISSIQPTGKTPFDPLDMHVTPHGFRFDFTEPLAADSADPSRWPASSYYYLYHAQYGSPEIEKTDVLPTKVTLSNGGKTAEVELPEMKLDFLYDFNLAGLRSASGESPLNPRIAYTLRKVPKN
jgi:glucose/arabinose dehydrogenase